MEVDQEGEALATQHQGLYLTIWQLNNKYFMQAQYTIAEMFPAYLTCF